MQFADIDLQIFSIGGNFLVIPKFDPSVHKSAKQSGFSHLSLNHPLVFSVVLHLFLVSGC